MSGINILLKTGGLTITTKDVSKYVHFSIQYRGGDTLPTPIVAKTKVYTFTSVDDLYAINSIYKSPTAYSDMLTAYHVKQFFDINPTGLLYMTFYNDSDSDSDICEGFDVALDTTKGGNRNIQLFGINSKSKLTADIAGVYNTKLKNMQLLNSPAYAVISCYLGGGDELPDFSTLDYRYIGVDVCQDLTPGAIGHTIYTKGWTLESNTINQCGALGLIMGRISSIAVHQNIGWTYLGTLTGIDGWSNGGFSNGTPSNNSNALNDAYGDKGLIFVRYYSSITGLYFGGFRSACKDSDDYRTGNMMRTANKIIYVSQEVLFPFINSPIEVDAATGFLGQSRASHFSNILETALNDALIKGKMDNYIEVSGIKVLVDPNQEVISTKSLTCVVQFVPIGAAETINLIVTATNNIN